MCLQRLEDAHMGKPAHPSAGKNEADFMWSLRHLEISPLVSSTLYRIMKPHVKTYGSNSQFDFQDDVETALFQKTRAKLGNSPCFSGDSGTIRLTDRSY
jgi:hypothetical protein